MSQPEPLTEQQLAPDRERLIRRNYAAFDSDGTVNVLLVEIDRLRAEGASHEAQVMRRCAEFVRDTYDGQWADDAAATLERDADITEHGCPGYEDAGWGDTEAERQLANCKHCGRPRAVCLAAPEATSAPLGASQPSEAPVEGETATRAATGHAGDPPPAEDFTGTQPCGHDDYHSPHEWADRPNTWCPGHSYDDDQADIDGQPQPAV